MNRTIILGTHTILQLLKPGIKRGVITQEEYDQMVVRDRLLSEKKRFNTVIRR